MAVNDVLYSDSGLTTLFNGNSQWYKIIWKGAVGTDDVYAVQISSTGVVLAWEYCPSTTTTTSTSTSTTTTTAAPTTTSTSTSTTTAAGPQCNYDGLTIVCDGGTTTSTSTTSTSTSTSTTTAGPGVTYIAYPADKYVCNAPNCGAFVQATEIAFPDTYTPVINKWYSALTPDGYAYQLTSTTPSTGPGLVMYEQQFNTCGLACSI
jgi:hypothetical protein